jgi:cytochrome c2
MRKFVSAFSLTAALAIVGPTYAVAAGDNSADADLMKIGQREYYTKCYACHSLEEDGGHKLGPNLWGVFGAKAGSKAGFVYSDALKKSGITWTAATMDKWLASPSAFVPGNQMAYAGLPNEQDRKALIAYLRAKTGAK